jgi:glycosyltransferase involved in cell wall biosynthesis
VPDPKVTVIVPAHNARRTIVDCLAGLSRQTAPGGTFEVIVADDGSTDDTADIAERTGAKTLRLPKRGPAAARNAGARVANGDILLFTDADCVPSPIWVEAMLQGFAESEVVGVKGAYRSRQPELVARFVQLEYEDKYDRMRHERYIDFIDTYSAGYRRQVFLENGGFDLSFPSASVEDQEFSFRLASKGHRMVFQPAAIVYHQHVNSVCFYFRKKLKIGYWKVLVHRLHPDKVLQDSHTPQVLKLQTLLAPLVILGCLGGFVRAELRLLTRVSAGFFLVSTVPFVIKAVPKDRAVAIAAPYLLFVRAVGLSFGLLAGLLKGLTKLAASAISLRA